MTINHSAARETSSVTMTLTVNSHRISEQEAAELHNKLTQLALTNRQPSPRGAGPNAFPDVWIEFVLVSAASGVVGSFAWESLKKLVKQVIQMLHEQHLTAHEQQTRTTGIVLPNVPITDQNVTISISTLALLPEQLAQVPDWLAALPNRLHQPPLAKHTVEHVTVPVGYIGISTQYEDTTDPLRYCTIRGPTIPSGIAVFDTHTRLLIFPYNDTQHRSSPTVLSLLKRLWRSR